MAINGISGKPGGGKSYEAVKNHVLPALEDGRKIITNLPLQLDHIVDVYDQETADLVELVEYNYHEYGSDRPFSKASDFLKYDTWKNEKGQGVMFVIDECHLSMPNGKTNAEFQAMLEYLSMHRHYGHDILLITQNFKKVHRDIRDMINLVYRAIKKSFNGQDDAYILKIHEGCTTTVVNTKEREYESYVFKFYKSHTMSDKSVEEAHTQDVKGWKDSGFMKGAYVFLFIALLLILKLIHMVFFGDDEEIVEPVIEEVQVEKVPIEQPVDVQHIPIKPAVNKPIIPRVESEGFTDYEQMVTKSKAYHPFHKVELSVSGYSEDLNYKLYYFSAQQNGQHIFTISSKDLLLAGYDVRVFSECAIRIKFYEFQDYLTCNRQHVGVMGAENVNDTLAMND